MEVADNEGVTANGCGVNNGAVLFAKDDRAVACTHVKSRNSVAESDYHLKLCGFIGILDFELNVAVSVYAQKLILTVINASERKPLAKGISLSNVKLREIAFGGRMISVIGPCGLNGRE
jgi:hypothetical protein